ncbi:MAG: cobalamin-dependent protein [Gammaproteobacteria bacterium]|nr:cobalamin-dependent protein [Gammaproteobacteria bacterium]MBP6053671.1 cobalamin-dependent protein [Pseudomonadales bacterium]MBK6584317.1 cobalamin-dependent protein [Gammaproteobacteria bacterium]MBK7168439.1 cobalamin-dependent protein [Gammaproteobacteria bacterium]MBK7520778.1 cobalamin-dependent protein [Gammaproteobacteria bacterium]
MATIADLRQLVSETKPEQAAAMTAELLAAGLDPMAILEEGVMSGLSDVGDRFAAKKAIVLDLVRAGVTAKACIPLIQKAFPEGKGMKVNKKIVLGTMLSQHNIGKNLVSTLLSIGGFEVIDIGEKNSPLDFYKKAESVGADMIAVSVVFAPAMEKFSELISLLSEMNVRDKYPVIVGGAVTTRAWAEAQGADGWGAQAKDGVELARKLLKIS